LGFSNSGDLFEIPRQQAGRKVYDFKALFLGNIPNIMAWVTICFFAFLLSFFQTIMRWLESPFPEAIAKSSRFLGL
jgi:hypothetical protein